MTELLILRLEGPLQSWGLRSRWDPRDTGSEPSKSGVIGLLGCALGYPRNDPRLEQLDAELSFAVRLDRPGSVMVDFQTITGFLPTADGGFKVAGITASVKLLKPEHKPTTIVSPRAYLQDAAFLVVLSGPSKTLRQCRDALLSPRWPIYFGRRACPPTRPVFDRLTNDFNDTEQALSKWPWSFFAAILASKSPPDKLEAFVEDPGGPARRPDAIRLNPARMYGERRVRRLLVDRPDPEKGDPPCTYLVSS